MVLHTYLSKLLIVCPRRVNTLIGSLFAEVIPLVELSHHLLFAVVGSELPIVHDGHAFNHDRVAVGVPIFGYLFGLFEVEGEVDACADPSLLGGLEPVFLDEIGELSFGPMVDDCSLWAVSRSMVHIVFLADSAEMLLMSLIAADDLTHFLFFKKSIN